MGEDSVSGPDSVPVEVVEADAAPSVLPFEDADPGFATGPPFSPFGGTPFGVRGLGEPCRAGPRHGRSGGEGSPGTYGRFTASPEGSLDPCLSCLVLVGEGVRAPVAAGATDSTSPGRL